MAPFGQLPVLELNGGAVRIAQSRACERFVAAAHGLLGGPAWEAAEIESVCEFVRDLYERWVALFLLPHAAQGAARNAFVRAADLAPLQRWAPAAQPFLVGAHLSLADIALMNLLLEFDFAAPDALAAHSCGADWLRTRRDNIAALPLIAAYLAKRPDRRF